MNPTARIVVVILAVAALGGAFFWLRHPAPIPAAPVASNASPRPQVAPVPAPPPAPAPAAPAVRHPLGGRDLVGGPLPALDSSDGAFAAALSALLGNKALTRFLVLDDFARHFVATVENLATDNAAAELWPVRRTPGRFLATPAAENATIAAGNAERYTPFVRLAEAIDTERAVSLYRHFYPLLQRAYEELGYPGRYFNDRLVEVIDQLLATPEPAGPIAVKKVALPGTAASAGAAAGEDAHALYVFADPALEALSAGQKILLRVGPNGAARLEAKLTEVRQRLVERGSGASVP